MDYKDYDGIGKQIVKLTGGKENISNLTHCITRLRFVLKNRDLAQKAEIEKLPLVMSVVEQGGQFQIVVGNKVGALYESICPMLGLETEGKGEQEKEENVTVGGSVFDRILAFITGVFTPILGILTAEGVLKGLLVLLPLLGVLDAAGPTYAVLNAISDILYYFFPVFMAASTARYLKMNQYIGMLIGAGMIAPQFVAAAADGSIGSFLGIPMTISSYTSTVFPAIFAVLGAHFLIKLLNRVVPAIVRFFLVPLLAIVIVIPVTFWIVGPVITLLSNGLASLLAYVYGLSPIVAGILIGGPWMILVMLGLHNAFIPIFIMDVVEHGCEPICGLFAANQFAVAGAAIAMGLVLKKKEKKAEAFTNGITCLLGVSEPSIYGQLIPYKTPFIIAVIMGSVGGAIGGASGLAAYAFGVGGILGFANYINPATGVDMSFIIGFGTAIICFFATIVITHLVMKKDPRIRKENQDA